MGIGALLAAATAAHADSAEPVNLFAMHANPMIAVAAVQVPFEAMPGQAVRLSVYDSADAFLEDVVAKHHATVGEGRVAVMPLEELAPGEYAFVAYLDENGDGKLNRGKLLGRPKEPVAFSNGVKPKLRKPKFEETKVSIKPGAVVVINLDD